MKKIILTLLVFINLIGNSIANPGCNYYALLDIDGMINNRVNPLFSYESVTNDLTEEYDIECSFNDSISFVVDLHCKNYFIPCQIAYPDSAGILEVISDTVWCNYAEGDCGHYCRTIVAHCPPTVSYICFHFGFGIKVIVRILRVAHSIDLSSTINVSSLDEKEKLFEVNVYDFTGREILRQHFDNGVYEEEAFSFLHQNLPSGLYLLAMKYEEEVVYRKIGLNYEY